MNYPLFINLLKKYQPEAPIILEWVKEQQLSDRRKYIEELLNI